jgi:hypothetical protein
MPMIYFHSHHKCASRWAIKYLREVSNLNCFDFSQDDKTDNVKKSTATLTFFGNSDYRLAVDQKLWGTHFVRNPLNIIVSSYFSHLNTHPDTGWGELTTHRRILKSIGFEEGLYLTVTFLERSDIGLGTSGTLFALRNWDYEDPRFKTIRVEDFVLEPSRWLKEAIPLSQPLVPPDWRYAFEAFSGGRRRGEVDDHSHYRSGDPGEWKKYLPPAIVTYVQENFAGLLTRHYPEVLSHDRVASAA